MNVPDALDPRFYLDEGILARELETIFAHTWARQQRRARRGHRPRRGGPARDQDPRLSPGPLAAKDGAVGWFADRIRADLGQGSDVDDA
jgi:hypothetical protein